MQFVERPGGGVDIIFSFVMDAGGGIPLWLLNKTQPQVSSEEMAAYITAMESGMGNDACTSLELEELVTWLQTEAGGAAPATSPQPQEGEEMRCKEEATLSNFDWLPVALMTQLRICVLGTTELGAVSIVPTMLALRDGRAAVPGHPCPLDPIAFCTALQYCLVW